MSKAQKNYSFTIDANDPKYSKLIDFLEEIDSGARSFIIRQILNSYIKSQTSSPVFGLITGNTEKAVEQEVKKEEIKKTVQTIEHTNTSNSVQEKNQQEEKEHEEEKIPKKQSIPQLAGLKNQFS